MSLTHRVARVVKEHGSIRTDALVRLFPDHTLDQVGDAARNASFKGLIHCARRERVGARASIGVWVPGPRQGEEAGAQRVPASMAPRGEYGIPRVSSVWQLGSI